jgi:hypothetical protein
MLKRLSSSEGRAILGQAGALVLSDQAPSTSNKIDANQHAASPPADNPDQVSDAESWHSDDLEELIAGLEQKRICDSNEGRARLETDCELELPVQRRADYGKEL